MRQVDLLVARQRQQDIDRPFIPLDIQDEFDRPLPVALGGGVILEQVFFRSRPDIVRHGADRVPQLFLPIFKQKPGSDSKCNFNIWGSD
jgi:hypothetical protein